MKKQFEVKMIVGNQTTSVIVTANNSAHAIVVAREMYPHAKVQNAKPL